jgi:hypothetical protein
MKSIDGGATWVASNTGLTTSTDRAIEANGTSLFVGGEIGTSVVRAQLRPDRHAHLRPGDQ